MPKPLHNLADAYSPIQRAEWARENVRIALANVRESLDVLYARFDDAERAEIRAEQPDADTEAYVEAYVEVADAERDALRDEYVNSADNVEPAPAPDFKPNDLVNISDPGHKLFGTRGSVIGYVYDPDGVVVEYDNLGNTVTVTASQLMHHTEFVKLPDEYFAAAEQTAREAKSVRQIEREIAIEAGDDPEDGEL